MILDLNFSRLRNFSTKNYLVCKSEMSLVCGRLVGAGPGYVGSGQVRPIGSGLARFFFLIFYFNFLIFYFIFHFENFIDFLILFFILVCYLFQYFQYFLLSFANLFHTIIKKYSHLKFSQSKFFSWSCHTLMTLFHEWKIFPHAQHSPPSPFMAHGELSTRPLSAHPCKIR